MENFEQRIQKLEARSGQAIIDGIVEFEPTLQNSIAWFERIQDCGLNFEVLSDEPMKTRLRLYARQVSAEEWTTYLAHIKDNCSYATNQFVWQSNLRSIARDLTTQELAELARDWNISQQPLNCSHVDCNTEATRAIEYVPLCESHFEEHGGE